MSKYIDADHLKVEIEKHIKEVKDVAEIFTPNLGFFDAKLSGIYDVMAIIDSLQQEQPEGLEEAAEKYADSMGLRGFDKVRTISDFKAGAEWKEQPEVDLEKEISRWVTEDCGPSDFNPFADHWCADDIIATAQHFYELGLNGESND